MTPIPFSDAVAVYLGYLHLAARATQEGFIVDFATGPEAGAPRLQRVSHHCIHVTSFFSPFSCGRAGRVAQTDVCLINHPTYVLLVLVEDKILTNRTDAEAQVVTDTMAAFQYIQCERLYE